MSEEKNVFSGVTFERQDTQVKIETCGYRDIANKLSIHADTKFGTASMGKTFIAVAIMQLIESDKLSFSTTIKEIYNGSLGTIEDNITIHELLTHTSGIQDYFDESINDDYESLWKEIPNYSIRKNSDILPLFINKVQDNTRRGKFIYNNAGYVLLADIIEKIDSNTFDNFLNENIFKKLNMTNTGYYELDQLPENTATSYIKTKNGSPRSNIYSIDSKGTGAGGCFTTVIDICNFWDGLFSFKIISEESVSEMFKKHSESDDEKYGLGFWLTKDEEYIFMEGSDPGISCISLYNLKEKNIYTVISNYEDNVWQMARDYLVR